jgi:hypothetical protein
MQGKQWPFAIAMLHAEEKWKFTDAQDVMVCASNVLFDRFENVLVGIKWKWGYS